jgi:hypothetical protein
MSSLESSVVASEETPRSTPPTTLPVPRPAVPSPTIALLMLSGFGLAAAPVFFGIPNHDVAWLLHAAGRVCAGERLYVDVIETNPPLIVWLSLAPICLARSAGISEILALRLLVLIVVGCSLLLADRVLRQTFPDRLADRRLFLLAGLFALLPMSGYDFGQREHLMFALVLPYVLMVAGRADRVPMVGGLPWIVGMFAGTGFALKPHFAMLWVALEGYLALTVRGARTWLRPEALAVAAMGSAYALAILLITPDYLDLVRWARPVYAACTPVSLGSLIGHASVFASLAALAAFGLLRPGGRHREICRVVLIADLGFLGIAWIQCKGYPYHYYPSMAASMLLLVLLYAASRGSGAGRARVVGVLCGGLAAGVMVQASVDRVAESLMWKGDPTSSSTTFGRMARLTNDHAQGGSVFTFSAAVAASFPLVNVCGIGWASRHPCLWFLPGLYSVDVGPTSPHGYRPIESMGRTERSLFDSVVNDLRHHRPALIFVDESERKEAFRSGRFDYLGYYSQDQRFAEFWRDYEPIAKVDRYRAYRRLSRASRATSIPHQTTPSHRSTQKPGSLSVVRTTIMLPPTD